VDKDKEKNKKTKKPKLKSFIRINLDKYEIIGYHGDYIINIIDGKHKYNSKLGDYEYVEKKTRVVLDKKFKANLVQCLEYIKGDLPHEISKVDIESVDELVKIERYIAGRIDHFGELIEKHIEAFKGE